MTVEKQAARHPWRENLEALTMAIAVALLFKVFILEISKIPSGSMQPTLMGSPETQVFDRVLVDKVSYGYRDPERFEIVVFKHPLEQSRVMVKRLVGMPGESLKIEHGDLWHRTDASQEWRHLRRPEKVQRTMWRRLDRLDRKRSKWAQEGGMDWTLVGRSIEAGGPGRARYQPDLDAIVDLYTDGYHDSLRSDIGDRHPASGTHSVGDLRLEGRLEARPDTEALRITLTEGRRDYTFVLPGPAAGDAVPTIEASEAFGQPEDVRSARAEATWSFAAGDATSFAVENLDDRLGLEVEGEVLLWLDIEPSARQESTLSLELVGGGGHLDELTAYRDIYYYSLTPGNSVWSVEIPAEHYVVLGDNTQDSADSRAWESVTMTWDDAGHERSAQGNLRMGMAQANPVQATFPTGLGWAYRDLWGERHWIPQADILSGPIPGARYPGQPGPLVPRHLVLGRAMAVFWPLEISRRMWRLGWLH